MDSIDLKNHQHMYEALSFYTSLNSKKSARKILKYTDKPTIKAFCKVFLDHPDDKTLVDRVKRFIL